MFVERLTKKEIVEIIKECCDFAYPGKIDSMKRVKESIKEFSVGRDISCDCVGVRFFANEGETIKKGLYNADYISLRDFSVDSNILGNIDDNGVSAYYMKKMYDKFGDSWFNAFYKYRIDKIVQLRDSQLDMLNPIIDSSVIEKIKRSYAIKLKAENVKFAMLKKSLMFECVEEK